MNIYISHGDRDLVDRNASTDIGPGNIRRLQLNSRLEDYRGRREWSKSTGSARRLGWKKI